VVLTGITKTYPGVVANREVHLRVRRGEVHALCGENGAGKSTLMRILYGMTQPDAGTIEIDGAPVRFRSSADAIAAGIGMVHQHFMLADHLTVAENIVLGAEAIAGIGARAAARIVDLGARTGLRVRPDQLVEELGVAQRQRVEILKVLYRSAKVIILDEPTAVLVPQEVDELFDTLRGMRSQGFTFLFISHKLGEVMSVADQVTVLRKGATVATVDPKNTSARQLAEMMVGTELLTPPLRESTVTNRVMLEVDDLTVFCAGRPLLDGLDLRIHAGEILGVAGVDGNGQNELVETLMGLREAHRGRIVLNGLDVTTRSTVERRYAGVGFVPEDRHRHGLLLTKPLWFNRVLGAQRLPAMTKGPWLNIPGARRDTERLLREFDVRTPGIDVIAGALSGGNQQRFVVGRELSGNPRLLIAAHPTRGVDIGAQGAIWRKLVDARDNGLAVLLISADLDELIGLSDRLKVISGGRFVRDVDPNTVTPEELGSAMTGVVHEENADA
jgi:simple sugar transport system ATP-binding protein